VPSANPVSPQGLAPAGSLPALESVQLDSGLTLADWVRVVGNKEPQPSIATASQAAAYIRRYGAYYELVEIVWRTTRRPEFSPHLGPQPDPAKLAALTEARRRLGDWPDLLYASARVRAQLGDAPGAIADLRRWMALSPADAPRRTEIAEQLLLADSDVAAAMTALTQDLRAQVTAPRRSVPPALASYAKDMARVRECIGAPATADAVVRQSHTSSVSNELTTMVTEWRALENGLSLLDVTLSPGLTPQPGESKEDDTVHSAIGPRWVRSISTTPDFRVELTWTVQKLDCTGTLLPARVGSKLSTNYTIDMANRTQTFAGRKPGIETSRSVQEVTATYEIVAGPLSLDDARRYIPELESDSRVPSDWRLFAMSSSGSSSHRWTEGCAGCPSGRQDFSRTLIFVEGPNITIAPFDDNFQTPRRVVLETLKLP
jgi:hypothetical protein